MNKALLIVSIQHALAMAIGKELRLRSMLQVFMKTCIQQLGLTSAHVYLFCDEHGRPISTKYVMNNGNFEHFLSIPMRTYGQLWQDKSELTLAAKDFSGTRKSRLTVTIDGKNLELFQIPHHGVIVFEAKQGIEDVVRQALKPILEKLSFSCYASLVHDSLLKEITTRQAAEAKISYQIDHDDLTKLGNRRQFNRRLEQEFARSKRRSLFGSVIYIDINQFKSINDTVGHDVGDSLLIEVADRLQHVVRKNGMVARFGGDEFILLLTDLGSDYRHAIDRTQTAIFNINNALEQPILVAETPYHLNCTMGFNIFPNAKQSWSDVVKHADMAMYEAKTIKAKHGLMYVPEMSERLQNKLSYFDEIKSALKNNEFELYYQPQCDQFGHIIGAEALLRWHNPRRGIESPAVYIPIAEESELIIDIGNWVLLEACRHIAILQKEELPTRFGKLSINVSAKQFAQSDFMFQVQQAITKHEVSPHLLGIEITENLLIDQIHETIKLISDLKVMGISCSVDDFGTGYSSLTYLKRIPVSLIKIDRSFVTNLHKDSEARSIAQLIISLGENLEKDILAEGVETKEELDCLVNLGCYKFQGYYFARPMPFSAFVEELQKQNDLHRIS